MIREMFGGWSLEEDAMEIKIDSTMLFNFGDKDGHTFLDNLLYNQVQWSFQMRMMMTVHQMPGKRWYLNKWLTPYTWDVHCSGCTVRWNNTEH